MQKDGVVGPAVALVGVARLPVVLDAAGGLPVALDAVAGLDVVLYGGVKELHGVHQIVVRVRRILFGE